MRRAFRIVAAVLGIVAIGFSLPFAVGALLGEADRIHRLHFVAGTLGLGVLLGVSLLTCAPARGPWSVLGRRGGGRRHHDRRDRRGRFRLGGYVTSPILLIVLFALHPERRSLFAIGGVDAAAAAMAALALVPAVAYALTQSELQRNGSSLDPHVEFHHYSGMATYALSLPLAALAAALRLPGRRIAVWIVGVTGAGLGLASLLLSDYVGAFDPVWAWLALAWGIVFVAVGQLRREAA